VAPKMSANALLGLKIGAITILGLTSSLALAQGGRQGVGPVDNFPDEHRPPTAADLDRMPPTNSASKPRTETAASVDTCLLQPLNLISRPSIAATQLQIGEKARKEYRKACVLLQKKKMADAEKHLQNAVSKSPQYAAAWVTLGQVLNMRGRVDEGRRACLQGSMADPKYVPAYLCIADLAARVRAWDEALKFSGLAIEIDPAHNMLAYEYHAAANLNLHDLPAAEKSGLRAVAIDTGYRDPRVHFILAQIYEAKGDSSDEAAQLREYLKYAGNSDDVAVVQQALADLEDHAGKAKAVGRQLGDILPSLVEPTAERWGPTEIDERIPPVLSEGNCPLPQILKEASNRTQDLIENLQRFSANERIEQVDTDKNGKKRTSNTEELNYVVQIGQNSYGYPTIEEYRSGLSGVQRAALTDSGTAAFALIFHPTHMENFDFRCEGLTELQGSQAWQLHFEESDDPNKSFIAIRVGATNYLPRFKGRAWIATGSYDVLRIETDLVAPIPQIDLQLEHMVIEYAPVEFRKRHVELWLPKATSLYMAYRGHRYERLHSYSDFQLFSVDSGEAIKEPTGKDLRWQLHANDNPENDFLRQ